CPFMMSPLFPYTTLFRSCTRSRCSFTFRMEAAMIRGMHAMFYSSEAEALRTFFRDKLGLPGVDVGDGWLIFNLREADLGVHPTEDRKTTRLNSSHSQISY